MLIHSIKLNNFLSFGSEANPIELRPLNVIIGPNGSGKSNLLESIELLRNAPDQFTKTIREGGGINDWLWKGEEFPTATINCIVSPFRGAQRLRYVISFTSVNQSFELVDERVENENAYVGKEQPYFYYHYDNGHPVINLNDKQRKLQPDSIITNKSILTQRRDPDLYPEITYLAQEFSKIKLYREWSFGRYTLPRLPQKTDLPNDYLESDGSNLGLVLKRIKQNPEVKRLILDSLNVLYQGIDDYDVNIEGGTVQVFFQEGRFIIPATRLSDGTLRYLCLLAILCHPTPPPLVCIEEPELGLHPDVLLTLAELMKKASEKCQLIVTTHSDILVDAMTNTPESILVAEKSSSGTTMTRLDENMLKPWLDKYRLGAMWKRGDIGGNRW